MVNKKTPTSAQATKHEKKQPASAAVAASGGAGAMAPAVASSFALAFMVVCLVVYLLHIAAAIMIPFVIALCLWYLINAMARGLSRVQFAGLRLPRFLCFLLAILGLAAGLWFILNLINHNVRLVREAIPVYQANLELVLPKFLDFFKLEREALVTELKQYINLTTMMATIAATFTGLAGKTLVVMFYTGFLLYEQRFFERKIENMFSDPETQGRVRTIIKNIDTSIQRYIWVKVVVSAATGLLTFFALKYFNVNFNQFWGLMAFVLNFIPYIGSLLAIAMPSVIALVQFNDISMFLSVALTLSVIQITLGSIIDPRLLGDSLNISPIMIIFSLAAWGMIWGIPGMFLSIPILAMVVITLGQFPATRGIAVLLTKTGNIDHEVPRRA